MEVTFSNGQKRYTVPGYFAADGHAAHTSATTGQVWRVHFTPDEVGEWRYEVSFRTGSQVAINTAKDAGVGLAPIDGKTGTFNIGRYR